MNDKGQPKHRRIDDHTAGHTNLAGTRKRKISMAMSDYLVVMLRGAFESRASPLHLCSEDMKSAYRQLPLPDAQAAVSITSVYCPSEGKPHLFEMYGQPFRAQHAVPNFIGQLNGSTEC